jgi:hypothetical protein
MSHRGRSALRRFTAPAWALVLLLALGVMGGPAAVPHLHESASAGLYNEAHVLEALATISVDTPMPASPEVAQPLPPVAMAVVEPARDPSCPLGSLASPRAPPLA